MSADSGIGGGGIGVFDFTDDDGVVIGLTRACLSVSEAPITDLDIADESCSSSWDSIMGFNYHDFGKLVRLSCAFTNHEDDLAIDPDGVYLTIKTPDGESQTLQYGVDDAVVQSEAGSYYYDADANQAGQWEYEWWSTGNGQGGCKRRFVVRPGLHVVS